MRQRVVDLHLDHLRIDHDETQILRREAVEHAGDERVDADALAGAGGAGDEQVRHLREVGDDRFAVNILAQRERNLARLCALPNRRLQQLAQGDFYFAAYWRSRCRPCPCRESARGC